MKRRTLSILLAGALAAGSLTGCGSSDNAGASTTADAKTSDNAAASQKTASSGETTIRMWTFLDPANTENGRSVALSQMMEEFEADHPGVKIVVEPQDYNIMTAKFLSATSTGDAPDIIWCARDELCGVLNANALEPLENLFLADWTAEEIADVDDVFFQFGQRDGKHYTMGLSKNSVGLYYRSDLLEAAGLSVPTTFDELLSTAKALSGEDKESGIQRYGLGQAFSTESADPQLIVNYIYDKQGNLFNEDGTANWSTQAGIDAMEWIVKTVEEGATPKEAVNTANEDSILEFEAGKYAMLLLGGVRMPNIREAASFDSSAIQFAILPGGNNFDGWFAGVWSGSSNKELAGEFLEKMYSPEADQLWVTLGGQAPLRKSTLENMADFFAKEENQYMKIMSDSFTNAIPLSNEYTVNGFKFDMNRAIQSVLTGGQIESSLKEAEAAFNSANGR